MEEGRVVTIAVLTYMDLEVLDQPALDDYVRHCQGSVATGRRGCPTTPTGGHSDKYFSF